MSLTRYKKSFVDVVKKEKSSVIVRYINEIL